MLFANQLASPRRWSTEATAGHLGGLVARSVCRIGMLADGWLGRFLTLAEALEDTATERAATGAGRHVNPDHFGISLWLPTRVARGSGLRSPELALL